MNVLPIMYSQKSRLLLAFIFGAIGTLSFSPFDLWPAAIISFFGLLFFTLERTSKQAFCIAFLWGFGLFGSGINWVYVSIADFGGMPTAMNIFIVVLLAAYLSIYPGLFGALLTRSFPKTTPCRVVLAAPFLWQCTEYLRGWVLTGFPWLQFGYSQIDGPMKSIAPIFGVEMITVFLLIISGLLALAATKRKVSFALIAIILVYSPLLLSQLRWVTPVKTEKTDIAIIQGNISQSIKWDTDYLEKTLDTYIRLSRPYFDKADMIIWPESAIPASEFEMKTWLSSLDNALRTTKSHLVTGIVDARQQSIGGDRLYNSIIVLGEKTPYQYPSQIRYNKHHLVPFGEFVPLSDFLRPIAPFFNLPMSGFSRGNYHQPPLTVGHWQLTAAICYEIILGNQVRDNFQPDTNFLLTLSNDAWFGRSIGPWQHFQMARMRALELGRPLLRSTNNGISAVINSQGEVENILPQFEEGALHATVTPTTGLTPYARWRNWPMWALVLILTSMAIYQTKRRRN